MNHASRYLCLVLIWCCVPWIAGHSKGTAILSGTVHRVCLFLTMLRVATDAPSPPTIYVDPNARLSGHSASGSFKHPFGDLRFALQHAAKYPGASIVLRPGTYTSNSNVNLVLSGLNVAIEYAAALASFRLLFVNQNTAAADPILVIS
jgi:hypothetical protein